MADRGYTTKSRAKRIALDYFKRPHPFRRAKLLLSIALAVVAAGAVIGYALRGDHRLYTSGPVSTAHAVFGTRCEDCHAAVAPTASGAVSSRATFFQPVSDLTCSLCHEGPAHHESQAFKLAEAQLQRRGSSKNPLACSSCHFEHKGRTRLIELGDRQCTQCHASLATKEGVKPEFALQIASFESGHPEFGVEVLRDGRKARVRLDDKTAPRDAAQIKLNHALHLKPGLGGLDDVKARTGTLGIIERAGQPALNCTYCHRLDERRVSIKPVAYAEHCAECHPLTSKVVPGLVAPHVGPRIVHACLRMALTETSEQRGVPPKTGSVAAKLNADCGVLRSVAAPAETRQEPEPEAPRGGRLGRTAPPAEARPEPEPEAPRGRRLGQRAAAEEPEPERPRGGRRAGGDEAKATTPDVPTSAPAMGQLTRVEKEMFGPGNCGKCHTLSPPAGGFPEVAPTAIPARWLPHSVFDHGVHRTLTCMECHGQATKSTDTADVLLPPVAVCRECHRAAGGARTACVECHLYHDKAHERDPNGSITIRRLTRGR